MNGASARRAHPRKDTFVTALQDLTPASVRVGFVGAGRLGTALAWGLHARGVRVAAVHSPRPAAAQALCAAIPGCASTNLQEVIERCDLVFLTTPDAAIEPTARAGRWRPGMGVVHCSGATEVQALAAAAACGAAIGGFHPMQTFGDPAAAVRTLPGCTVTIEAGPAIDGLLVALSNRLGCPVNRLPPGMRGRYHAAAGYASQFVNVLLDEAAQLWASWGATEAQAVQALLPLVRGTLSAVEAVGIARAMPGPVSRGDVGSIARHLQAVAPFGADTLQRYRTLCQATVRLAEGRGAIDASRAGQFRALLQAQAPANLPGACPGPCDCTGPGADIGAAVEAEAGHRTSPGTSAEPPPS